MVWISLLDSSSFLSDCCSHYALRCRSYFKTRPPTIINSPLIMLFLRSYQPYQINTLLRYIPCTKRRASGNSCQPQTSTQASKKAHLIVSSSWCFHFYISFANLITFTRCTDNVIFEKNIFAITSVYFEWESSICRSIDVFKIALISLNSVFKVADQEKKYFCIYMIVSYHFKKYSIYWYYCN